MGGCGAEMGGIWSMGGYSGNIGGYGAEIWGIPTPGPWLTPSELPMGPTSLWVPPPPHSPRALADPKGRPYRFHPHPTASTPTPQTPGPQLTPTELPMGPTPTPGPWLTPHDVPMGPTSTP